MSSRAHKLKGLDAFLGYASEEKTIFPEDPLFDLYLAAVIGAISKPILGGKEVTGKEPQTEHVLVKSIALYPRLQRGPKTKKMYDMSAIISIGEPGKMKTYEYLCRISGKQQISVTAKYVERVRKNGNNYHEVHV
ncbi:MAG: hypothetical protein HY514_04750 [Candidatus Aenigmarchaeota archaeon]|nr:hypothetical protein [Candidatus Aenigmarchaeota archaeon]